MELILVAAFASYRGLPNAGSFCKKYTKEIQEHKKKRMNSYRMRAQCCWKMVSLHICFQFVSQKQLNDYEIVLWVCEASL